MDLGVGGEAGELFLFRSRGRQRGGSLLQQGGGSAPAAEGNIFGTLHMVHLQQIVSFLDTVSRPI